MIDEGQRYSLHVTHADLLPHRTGLLRVLPNTTSDAGAVTLRRITTDRAGDYSLAVRVSDADGRPVEGAWVKVYRRLDARHESSTALEASGANWEQDSAWEAGVQTDATGTAVVAGHHIGSKWVIVAARHLGKPDLRHATEVKWTGHQELEFALPKTSSIRGRLLFPIGSDVELESVGRLYKLKPGQGAFPIGRSIDRRDDDLWTRVGGCQLHAIAGVPEESVAAELAADGSFTIPGLVDGTYRVVYRGTFAEAARFDVPAGATGVDLELKSRDDPRPIGHHLAEIHARCVDAASGSPSRAIRSSAVTCRCRPSCTRPGSRRAAGSSSRAPRVTRLACRGASCSRATPSSPTS
ncbi:MAG: hypothetical protein EXS13_10060 [Planctomycetes bacterium]|nr:hypothetical protein [Planctomycetota bacterium]